MIEEQAIILAVDESSKNSIATLEIMRQIPCGICGQTRGCGNSLWGKVFSHKSNSFKANNSINAKVGDSVVVGIDEKTLLHGAFLLYALPLATLLLGALVGTYFVPHTTNQTDLYTAIGAALGLLLGLAWVKGHTTSSRYSAQHKPIILRKIKASQ